MDTRPLDELLNRYFRESCKESNIVIVRGEFGIGKSFHINRLLENKGVLPKDIVQIEAHPFDESNYSTLNQAIYSYIKGIDVHIEMGRKLLQKASTLIPRFGQFISDVLDPGLLSDSRNELVKRAGINTEEPNLLGLIKFFENQSGNEPFIFYCRNIQWFDRKSWEILLRLLMLISEKKWFCILSYTSNAQPPVLTHEEINNTISSLKELKGKPAIHILDIERWARQDIPALCSSILQNRVAFSETQYDLIFQYTEGLPLYVKTILDEFIQHKYIFLNGEQWVSCSAWDSEKIREILKDSVKEKINRVYREIPESRDILEIGSIIHEDFTDTSISRIFQSDDHFNILLQVENRFRIIQYILEGRLWKFEHYIIQDYIYRSLGDKAKSLHLKIAEFLESNSPGRSYVKIAQNYRLGGNMERSAFFYLKEIKELMDLGCYVSASTALADFEEHYEEFLFFDEEKDVEFEFLKARCMFHNVHYQLAKQNFNNLLERVEEEGRKAECNRWLARTLLKLESLDDFRKALEHLKKAENYYEAKGDYSGLGDVLLDAIVAYAHLNDKNTARELYKKAEVYFNMAKDKIGLLRLQRKSIIFMEAKVSAPLLAQSAKKWDMLKVPHEKIMCLNNAAVQYIYLQQYDEAKKLLKEAIEESVSTDGFGQVYLNNNIGLVHIMKGNKRLVKKNFQEAKKGKQRFVEQLIVDINQSAYNFSEKGATATTVTTLKELYEKAVREGENSYIVPTAINLGVAYIQMGDVANGVELLESIQDSIHEYSAYELAIWYKALYNYYREHNQEKQDTLQQRFEKPVNYYLSSYTTHPQVAYVTMEYWSDN